MVTEIYATGKTVEDAVAELKNKLCVDDLDNVEWNVVNAGKKGGLFGIGAVPAKVVAYVETPDEAPAPVPVKEKPQKKADGEDKRQAAPKNEKKHEEKRAPKAEKTAKTEAAPRAEKPKKPKAPTTEKEVAAALNFVNTLVKNLEIEVSATVGTDEENGSCITVAGKDAGVLIGHHGETLDAVQYLANLAANRAEGRDDHERITVDIEGYREKREETLRALAKRKAEQVQKYGRSVMLEPMNPYERRIIHSEVQNIEGVSTNSIGTDSNRKVVIFLTEKGMGRLPQRGEHRRGDNRRRGRRGAKPQTEAPAEAPTETPVEASAQTAPDGE